MSKRVKLSVAWHIGRLICHLEDLFISLGCDADTLVNGFNGDGRP